MMRIKIRYQNAVVGAGLMFTIFVLMTFLAVCMFQYSLYTFTGRDVHWTLDTLGALVLNGLNFPIFVFAAIYRACGYPIPMIGE